jgi:hypothetical protein
VQELVTRNPGGRPPHQLTDAQRREAEGYASNFMPHGAIAAMLGVSKTTLLKHYGEELDRGDAKADVVTVGMKPRRRRARAPWPTRSSYPSSSASGSSSTTGRSG